MKCPGCGQWFDMRDLAQVADYIHDSEIEVLVGPIPPRRRAGALKTRGRRQASDSGLTITLAKVKWINGWSAAIPAVTRRRPQGRLERDPRRFHHAVGGADLRRGGGLGRRGWTLQEEALAAPAVEAGRSSRATMIKSRNSWNDQPENASQRKVTR
jgi:hypothetical protein